MPAEALKPILPQPFSAPLSIEPLPVISPERVGEDLGGTVGELHRVLNQRLTLFESQQTLPLFPVPVHERVTQLASRALGLTLLAIGFVAVAWLII